jgi:hypothetical protein
VRTNPLGRWIFQADDSRLTLAPVCLRRRRAEGRLVEPPVDNASHAAALYDTLERTVLPLFYQHHDAFVGIMRYAIALNGSFFTAQRMLHEYAIKAYALDQQNGSRRETTGACCRT